MDTLNKRKRAAPPAVTNVLGRGDAANGVVTDCSVITSRITGAHHGNPCQHLHDYRAKQGQNAFRCLQKSLVGRPPGRASVKRDGLELARSCGKCRGHRLYACLACSSISCWSASSDDSHARMHAQAFPGHELAVDIDRAELFCCVCGDQVYDPDFDRMVLCGTTTTTVPPPLPSTSNGCTKPMNVYRRQKKLKGAEYKPWVPSVAEEVALKEGSTPLVEESAVPNGLRGLNNMGNTCFMNSVLQALLHTPPLRNYFLSDKHNRAYCQSKAKHFCIGCDMDAIFSAAFSGDRSPYSPAQLLYSWWQHAENLAGYQQQDAHEFFISTVEGIHANSEVAPKGVSSNDPDCRCIVHRVFSGLLRSDVTCTACGFTSTTYDPCVDLSLDLEPSFSGNGNVGGNNCGSSKSKSRSKKKSGSSSNSSSVLYDTSSTLLGCLDRFTRPEKLGSDEMLFCESCKVRQEFIKQMSVRKLPLVLCFHIKRFEQQNYASRKVDRFMQFPFFLDMAAYLSSSIVRLRHGNRLIFVDESGGGRETPASTSASEFELFAVITHSGRLDAGHYVSYLRLAGEWYKCDDAWITKVDESTVRAAEAYMLYYVQKTLSYKSSSTTTSSTAAERQHDSTSLIESKSLMDGGYSGACLLG